MIRFGERAAALSGLAAQLLDWRPDEFWSATPTELASALTSDVEIEPMAADDLAQLLARFPDRME